MLHVRQTRTKALSVVVVVIAVIILLLYFMLPKAQASNKQQPAQPIFISQAAKLVALRQELPKEEPKEAPAQKIEEPAKIDCTKQQCIALTFDDGPSPQTGRLLDVLKEKQAHATFFMIGMYVERHSDFVERIAKEGHEVGGHGWSHKDLTDMADQDVSGEIKQTNDAIFKISGKKPVVMRPPYGKTDERILKLAGMAQILWNIDPRDWQNRDNVAIGDSVIGGAEPGGIVIMHDIYPTTVDAIGRIIDELKNKGYTFATVSELLNQGKTPDLANYYHQ